MKIIIALIQSIYYFASKASNIGIFTSPNPTNGKVKVKFGGTIKNQFVTNY